MIHKTHDDDDNDDDAADAGEYKREIKIPGYITAI